MYDEVMQLIALAKNDEQYFKRIEELKAKQQELAYVMEIAKTLKDADMYLAGSRQKASELEETAKEEAEAIKAKAVSLVSENKSTLEKNKVLQATLKEKQATLDAKEKELVTLKETMDESIATHRKLTAERSVEQEEARKVKLEFETKLRKLKEIANT
jgi:hypothetical protein